MLVTVDENVWSGIPADVCVSVVSVPVGLSASAFASFEGELGDLDLEERPVSGG
jgi:hypothetical protein